MPFGKGEEGVGDLLLLVWFGGVHGGSVGPDLSAELGWGIEILMGACFGGREGPPAAVGTLIVPLPINMRYGVINNDFPPASPAGGKSL